MSGFQTTNDSITKSEDYSVGYYVGTVTSNADSLGIARVQAQVNDLYDSQQGEVPFIGPIKDSPYGFGTSAKGPYGVYGTPPVGSVIKVELQNGDEHNALYTGLLTAPNANPRFKAATVWGYQDPDGNYMIYDLANHTYLFVTTTGASINIDANGKRITSVNGDVETSNGDWSVQVTGNASLQTSGNITASAQGNVNVDAQGSATVQGQTVSVIATGTATYTAAVHEFNGPIVASLTITAGGDITDSLNSGNTETMGNMRQKYNIHDHAVRNIQGGNDTAESDPPIPQM